MQISFQSGVYLGLNAVIGALSIYNTTARDRWITAFAVGVLVGTIISGSALNSGLNGYNPGNSYGMGWNINKDDKTREAGVSHLIDSVPGFFTTAVNTIALAVITKSTDLFEPYGSRYETVITGSSAFLLGYKLGHLFNLDRLRRSSDPNVTKFTAKAVI